VALTTHTLRYFDLQIEEGRGRDGGFLLLGCGKIVVNAPQLFSGSAYNGVCLYRSRPSILRHARFVHGVWPQSPSL
jgi:hypothetical protein